MGVDFVKKAAPSFHKALDRSALALRTPSLFNRDIPTTTRFASADICAGANLNPDDKVHLRIVQRELVLQRNNVIVARFVDPPSDFFEHVELGAGIARAEIKVVRAISQTVEVGLCE